MSLAGKLVALFVLAPIIFSSCGSTSPQRASGTGPGSGTGAGSGPGGGTGGSGSANSVPGYGEGIGASGETGPAKFLYVNPLPGGGPYSAAIQPNGGLSIGPSGGASNVNPMTMAIDPSGTFLFQTAQGYSGGQQGGLFTYTINRSNGSPGNATGSYLTGQALYGDIVDNQGKFLYVLGGSAVYGFSIQPGTGAPTPVLGSPYPVPSPSSVGYSQPATLMAVDQTNKFLYVSTAGGVEAFSINGTTGQLTPAPGSPFATDVKGPWTIVVTPNNSFLYLLQAQVSPSAANIYGFSIDQTSGALTPLPGSPFSAGQCGSVVPIGTVGIPGPDNMTIASAGKFMYDNCGVYSLNQTSGAIAQVSNQGPGDWPVIDPTGTYLWAIASDQQACFHCDEGIQAYSVDPNTGAFTAIKNGFLLLTNSAVGSINSIAITK